MKQIELKALDKIKSGTGQYWEEEKMDIMMCG